MGAHGRRRRWPAGDGDGARYLGFVEQHVFGMDGCEGATGKHAGAHPSQAKKRSI
jgi:hypothetical protein